METLEALIELGMPKSSATSRVIDSSMPRNMEVINLTVIWALAPGSSGLAATDEAVLVVVVEAGWW